MTTPNAAPASAEGTVSDKPKRCPHGIIFPHECKECIYEIPDLNPLTRKLMDDLRAAEARIQELERQLADMTTFGIIELGIRNPNVRSYMDHWESRTAKVEAELSRLSQVNEKLVEALTKLLPLVNHAEWNDNRCQVCGWQLKQRVEDGCIPGNCSYRPEHPAEQKAIAQQRAWLNARAAIAEATKEKEGAR